MNDIFIQATNDIQTLPVKPDDNTLLLLYGLYKQATIGDIKIDKPSFFNFKEVSKWNAWEKMKGMNKIHAQGNYIKMIRDLQAKSQQ